MVITVRWNRRNGQMLAGDLLTRLAGKYEAPLWPCRNQLKAELSLEALYQKIDIVSEEQQAEGLPSMAIYPEWIKPIRLLYNLAADLSTARFILAELTRHDIEGWVTIDGHNLIDYFIRTCAWTGHKISAYEYIIRRITITLQQTWIWFGKRQRELVCKSLAKILGSLR